MSTRQQRRARARTKTPVRRHSRRRRGTVVFVATITGMLMVGSYAIGIFRSNPRPLERGAIIGDHWHASYSIELCGKRLAPYPRQEGEAHSHGDAQIHLHPLTQARSGDGANLAAFFSTYETFLGMQDGSRGIILPDGSRYFSGDECPDGKAYNLEVLRNGSAEPGDPGKVIPHDGDEFVIRFGPLASQTTANPFVPYGPGAAPQDAGTASP